MLQGEVRRFGGGWEGFSPNGAFLVSYFISITISSMVWMSQMSSTSACTRGSSREAGLSWGMTFSRRLSSSWGAQGSRGHGKAQVSYL